MKRRIIINADDFGLSHSINQSIVTAFDQGVLTSTTLLVTREATHAAVALAKTHSGMQVGLHLDLDRFFTFEADGHFGVTVDDINQQVYESAVSHDIQEIRQEIAKQIELISRLGIRPTHVDGHHNIHLMPQILPHVLDLMYRFSLNKIRFSRGFYSTHSDTYSALRHTIDRMEVHYPDWCIEIDEVLPLGKVFEQLEDKTTEVIVHTDLPGVLAEKWRVVQFEFITSFEVRDIIDRLRIARVSYANL